MKWNFYGYASGLYALINDQGTASQKLLLPWNWAGKQEFLEDYLTTSDQNQWNKTSVQCEN